MLESAAAWYYAGANDRGEMSREHQTDFAGFISYHTTTNAQRRESRAVLELIYTRLKEKRWFY